VVPDIAIIDISMPGLTGLEILAIANSEKLLALPLQSDFSCTG
jgi:YesN/AraC family two-component response regulator